MAVTYHPDTKFIKLCFSKDTDAFGREFLRPMGLQLVYFADELTGALADGPYVEPVPNYNCSPDYQFEGEDTYQDKARNIIGFEVFDSEPRDGGGRMGHYRNASVL